MLHNDKMSEMEVQVYEQFEEQLKRITEMVQFFVICFDKLLLRTT